MRSLTRNLVIAVLSAASPLAAQFTLRATEVSVPLTAVDRYDHLVTDLRRTDLRLFENGRERPINALLLEEGPASVVFLLDVSGSMKKNLRHAREAVENILLNASPEDEFALIEFNADPDLTVPFSSSEFSVAARLKLLHGSGHTALVDSIVRALHEIKAAKHSRRAVVILSDGRDTRSRTQAAAAVRMAMESEVRIYSIELCAATGEPFLEDLLLERIANLTGGRHFATCSANKIPDIVSRIDVHRYYRIAFSPDTNASVSRHNIEVKWAAGANREKREARLFWRHSFEVRE